MKNLSIYFKQENNIRKVLVIGGIPEPIGGVSNFIYRLADSNMVTKIADIYPSKSKITPTGFKGDIFYYNGLLSLVFNLIFSKKLLAGITDIHFNFSSTRSLIIFLIPFLTYKKTTHLMLHHGILEKKYPSFLLKLIFKKINKIYFISEDQNNFYKKYIIKENTKLISSSSYIPLKKQNTTFNQKDIDNFIGEDNFLVISGYCSKIYNHDWVIKLFNEIELENKLIIFLYGFIDNEYLTTIKKLCRDNKRIKIIFNTPQNIFNYYLSKAKIYIRPNSVDSFGIAVADAINYGIPVLASDVCKRYDGTYLFKSINYKSLENAYLLLKNNPEKIPIQKNNNLNFSYDFL